MDERRTLTLLAWTIGGLVGIMFLLNGLALSLVSPPTIAAQPLASPESPAINATATLRLAADAAPVTRACG